MEGPRRVPGVTKNFKKTLILASEVIVQPPKHTFEIGIFFRDVAQSALPGQKFEKYTVFVAWYFRIVLIEITLFSHKICPEMVLLTYF